MKRGKPLALSLCGCYKKCIYYEMQYEMCVCYTKCIRKNFITPPPLIYSWETCGFFLLTIEHRRAAASVFTLLLSTHNLSTGYEQLGY